MDQQFIATIGPALGGKSTFCNHVPNFATFSLATPLYQMLAVVAGMKEVLIGSILLLGITPIVGALYCCWTSGNRRLFWGAVSGVAVMVVGFIIR